MTSAEMKSTGVKPDNTSFECGTKNSHLLIFYLCGDKSLPLANKVKKMFIFILAGCVQNCVGCVKFCVCGTKMFLLIYYLVCMSLSYKARLL